MTAIADAKDQAHLEALYEGRKAYQGELHDHAKTGGTSDGQRTLAHWRGALEALHMDFAAILDHRQVRHMYLPEWEDGLFICGTEPGTRISDSTAANPALHYNMLFPTAKQLEDLLTEFPEYEFTGGSEGHFRYPDFTRERFGELIDAVKAHGGFFVHPHPKQLMSSQDPLDYWFRDETGIEVFYTGADPHYTEFTAKNYALWVQLLKCGKRVWASAGGDGHVCANDEALTTIYARAHSNMAYLEQLRKGDFVCGAVGIRMCIGDVTMGTKTDFANNRLVFSVSDFHNSVRFKEHKYRVDLFAGEEIVFSSEISSEEPAFFAVDTKDVPYYRVEVFDVTRDLRIAIGNPVWNAE